MLTHRQGRDTEQWGAPPMALQVLSALESPWDADVALKSMTKHGREERKQNSTQNVLQKEKQSPNSALQPEELCTWQEHLEPSRKEDRCLDLPHSWRLSVLKASKMLGNGRTPVTRAKVGRGLPRIREVLPRA